MHNLSHPPFCFDFLFICCYCFVTIIFPRLIPIYIFLLLRYFNFSKCCKDTYSDSTVLDFNFMLPSYRICLLFSVQLMRTRTAPLSLSQLPLETLKYASPCAVVLPSTWKQPLMCKVGGISLTRKPVIQKFKCVRFSPQRGKHFSQTAALWFFGLTFNFQQGRQITQLWNNIPVYGI